MSGQQLVQRIAREKRMRSFINEGYSRKVASKWCKRVRRDYENAKKEYDFDKNKIKKAHNAGFLNTTIRKYDIKDLENTDYISDFDYLYLKPFNNSFEKWIHEIIFTNRLLKDHNDICREVYFSVVPRDGGHLILPVGGAEREYTVTDVINLLKYKGEVEFRPAFWKSNRRRFLFSYDYDNDLIFIDDKLTSISEIEEVIASRRALYIISEPVRIEYQFDDYKTECFVKLWIANDNPSNENLLSAEITRYWNENIKEGGRNRSIRKREEALVDLDTGEFMFDDTIYFISKWEEIKKKVTDINQSLVQISYYTLSIALKDNCLFKILSTSSDPILPKVPYNSELKEYLKHRVTIKKENEVITKVHRRLAVKNSILQKFIYKFCRKGVRPYMQKLWFESVKDDWKNTKGASIFEKIWAYKKGFLSFRIWQYGLNNRNYKDFLSDYDYHWLNRINNSHQKQINDKTSYRYIMEPFKELLPKYYFSVIKRNNKVEMIPMPDCPEDISNDIEGLAKLLESNGKLAFKASAGTHGDGFYCLAFENGKYFINDKNATIDEISELVSSINSFYIITEFLYMHDEIRKIYDKTVNTVRVMVINEHGYDPKIMQTYMRIGAAKTGYTDNVGYGGICAMVDTETGRIYKPETIKEHIFHECPAHPDTGVEIAGVLPNWDKVCESVLSVSRYLCELEYLGFDVAITNDGIQILEINIHQDLHKVADHSNEIKEFYNRKIEEKYRTYYPSKYLNKSEGVNVR